MPLQFEDRDSFMASGRKGFDVTPSSDELPVWTRFIMVTVDDMTVTGILEGDTTSHTTAPLKVGVPYPMAFKVISAVSAGAVKGYA